MDKRGIINRALSGTGNNQILILGENSDEALAAETAFDRALEYMIGEHQWPFVTKTADLARKGDSDVAPFTDLFHLPTDAWHMRTVTRKGYTGSIAHLINMVGIHTCISTGLQAVYVVNPGVDSTWHPTAVEALTTLTEAHLYRGLNEDMDMGDQREQAAELKLMKARSRVDQQNPARNAYKRTGRLTRRTRRV
ncbi:MAG: hypothetical protein AAF441_20345 [Pseudomonadota bacterium]